MLTSIQHLLEAILDPFFIALALLAIFLISLFRKGNKPLIRYGLVFAFLFLLTISTGFIPYLITKHLEDAYPPLQIIDRKIHWIVVLSGGQTEVPNRPVNGLLYSASIKRLLEGIRLQQHLPQATLLLSGGRSNYQIPEAQRLLELASWFSVLPHQYRLETTSRNTYDQIKAIKKILHEEQFYLVTSATHMPRALFLCQKEGLHPIAAPTDYTYFWQEAWAVRFFIPNAGNLFYLTVAWHEILGIFWYKLKTI